MQADYRKAVEQSLAKTVKGIRATHTTEVAGKGGAAVDHSKLGGTTHGQVQG